MFRFFVFIPARRYPHTLPSLVAKHKALPAAKGLDRPTSQIATFSVLRINRDNEMSAGEIPQSDSISDRLQCKCIQNHLLRQISMHFFRGAKSPPPQNYANNTLSGSYIAKKIRHRNLLGIVSERQKDENDDRAGKTRFSPHKRHPSPGRAARPAVHRPADARNRPRRRTPALRVGPNSGRSNLCRVPVGLRHA